MLQTPNSDGLINCFPQPGLLLNQPSKSMLVNITYLFNLVHPDWSFCRDKVNRAAGRSRLRRGQAHWCLVFVWLSGLFHHDTKPHFRLSGLGTVKTVLSWPKTIVSLPRQPTLLPNTCFLPTMASPERQLFGVWKLDDLWYSQVNCKKWQQDI
jgi:hypothetical protein